MLTSCWNNEDIRQLLAPNMTTADENEKKEKKNNSTHTRGRDSSINPPEEKKSNKPSNTAKFRHVVNTVVAEGKTSGCSHQRSPNGNQLYAAWQQSTTKLK